MELTPGMLPLKDGEREHVKSLLADHHGKKISITRRDPGESGPLIVSIDTDDYLVTEESVEMLNKSLEAQLGIERVSMIRGLLVGVSHRGEMSISHNEENGTILVDLYENGTYSISSDGVLSPVENGDN